MPKRSLWGLIDIYKYMHIIQVIMAKKVYKVYAGSKHIGNRIAIPSHIEPADGYTVEQKEDGTLIYRPVHV